MVAVTFHVASGAVTVANGPATRGRRTTSPSAASTATSQPLVSVETDAGARTVTVTCPAGGRCRVRLFCAVPGDGAPASERVADAARAPSTATVTVRFEFVSLTKLASAEPPAGIPSVLVASLVIAGSSTAAADAVA